MSYYSSLHDMYLEVMRSHGSSAESTPRRNAGLKCRAFRSFCTPVMLWPPLVTYGRCTLRLIF